MGGWLRAAIFAAASPALAAPALDDVLARQAASMGALEQLRSITLQLRMIEPEATYHLLARMKRPDRYRIDLRRWGVPVYSEGVGRNGAWQQRLLQWSPVAPSRDGARALLDGLEWFTWGRTLRELRGRGHRVEADDLDSNPAELLVTLSSGETRRYFVDHASGRILRSLQFAALHPDLPSGKARRRLEARYEDYRPVAGVVLPHRITVLDIETRAVAQTVLVESVRLDDEMPNALFEGR
jgi:hypothetical protein